MKVDNSDSENVDDCASSSVVYQPSSIGTLLMMAMAGTVLAVLLAAVWPTCLTLAIVAVTGISTVMLALAWLISSANRHHG